jgi:hypothetical protein
VGTVAVYGVGRGDSSDEPSELVSSV